MGGCWGKGQLPSLRQKDAGQHFICNHSNVFAVFRIQNSCWGSLGGGIRRASVCPIDCTVGAGCTEGWLLKCLQQPAPVCVAWVLTQRDCCPGSCVPGSLRVMACPQPGPSALPCPIPHPGQSQDPFLTLPIDHFKKPLFTV